MSANVEAFAFDVSGAVFSDSLTFSRQHPGAFAHDVKSIAILFQQSSVGLSGRIEMQMFAAPEGESELY